MTGPLEREEMIYCGESHRTAPAWYLELHLGDVSAEQVERIRDQARALADSFAGTDHPLAATAFDCVHRAAVRTHIGLGSFLGKHAGPPTRWILHLATDPDEAPARTKTERNVAAEAAEPLVKDADPRVAAVWRRWLTSFAESEFQET